MATRSRIGKVTDKGIKSIYCHWDGYPEHAGRMLAQFFSDEKMLDALLDLGDLGSIGSGLREADGTRPYGDSEAELSSSETELMELCEAAGCEYTYLWRDGTWLYTSAATFTPLLFDKKVKA